MHTLKLTRVVSVCCDNHNGKMAVASSQRKWVDGLLRNLGADFGQVAESAIMVVERRTGAFKLLLGDSRYLQATAFHPGGARLATGHGTAP